MGHNGAETHFDADGRCDFPTWVQVCRWSVQGFGGDPGRVGWEVSARWLGGGVVVLCIFLIPIAFATNAFVTGQPYAAGIEGNRLGKNLDPG